MVDAEEINKAINAHGAWKQRLRNSINTGTTEVTAEHASSDKNCDFGKWLYSLPPADRSDAHFSNIQTMHAQFHKCVGSIITLAQTGKKLEAFNAMAQGSEFATLSSKLTAALYEWRAAVSK